MTAVGLRGGGVLLALLFILLLARAGVTVAKESSSDTVEKTTPMQEADKPTSDKTEQHSDDASSNAKSAEKMDQTSGGDMTSPTDNASEDDTSEGEKAHPTDDASEGEKAHPTDDASEGENAPPTDDASGGKKASPTDDASEGEKAHPTDDASEGEKAHTTDDASEVEKESPTDDTSEGKEASPTDDASEDKKASPTDDASEGKKASPTDDASEGEKASPTDDGSEGKKPSPTDDASEGGKASPRDDASEGEKASPTDDASEGKKASPTDDASEGEKASSTDDTSEGEKASSSDDASEGGKASSSDDASEGEKASPTDDASEGKKASPSDDASEGKKASSSDDASEGEKASPTDDASEGEKASSSDDASEGEKASSSDDASEGEKASSSDDASEGEKASPTDDASEGKKAHPTDDESEGENASSTDDASEGEKASSSDDASEGETASPTDNASEGDASEGKKAYVTDDASDDDMTTPTEESESAHQDPATVASGEVSDKVSVSESVRSDEGLVGVLQSMTAVEKQLQLEKEAERFLNAKDAAHELEVYKYYVASWNYATNLTEYNKEIRATVQEKFGEFQRKKWQEFLTWKNRWEKVQDPVLRRRFKKYSIQGDSALSAKKLAEYNGLVTNMTSVYSKAKVCLTHKNGTTSCGLSLDPELVKIMAEERDCGQLREAWVAWRNSSGRRVRGDFLRYVSLSNEIAVKNNFKDRGEMWLESYEDPGFKAEVDRLWLQMRPLYQQLHAYVRRRLREVHGEDKISKKGPIPAHLLGNMWGQSWVNIYDLVEPYPNRTSLDVSDELKKQGYTALKIFQLSDKFFQELNLTAMPQAFWDHSVLEKPKDREIVCHAFAYDFSNGHDFRIKQCTEPTMEHLITAHHEMGHIQYYLQYKHLPLVFREGANSGFHEAVGDVLALSVQTPKHLHKIGLIKELKEDEKADLNFMLRQALAKVAFVPFGYLIDKYRWDVFSGATKPDDLNCDWWKLRYQIQGLKPAVTRDESQFDPGAKFHIPANVAYVRYFVAYVLQFQFQKSLCQKAGQYNGPQDPSLPLYKCDIDQSKEAGNALSAMLRLGSSKPWPDALEAITGQREMDASVMIEYFKPLQDWLEADNRKHGEFVGWEKDGRYCEGSKQATDDHQ